MHQRRKEGKGSHSTVRNSKQFSIERCLLLVGREKELNVGLGLETQYQALNGNIQCWAEPHSLWPLSSVHRTSGPMVAELSEGLLCHPSSNLGQHIPTECYRIPCSTGQAIPMGALVLLLSSKCLSWTVGFGSDLAL